MDVIDFTELERNSKSYAGADGDKISVNYEGEAYMVKFPAHATRNADMTYSNNCFSEYLGCHIFECIGIPTQKTLQGIFRQKGQQKLVVACRDFTGPHIILQDFTSFKKKMDPCRYHPYRTDLEEILCVLKRQELFDHETLIRRFWDMFLVDALIGNWDRHNGNWGFLQNTITRQLRLAPVYDCGSSLYPNANQALMENVLFHQDQFFSRMYHSPASAITVHGERIQYFEFISSLQNNDCNLALKRIVPRIDLKKIYKIIDETLFISELQSCFYKKTISVRKQKVFDESLLKLIHPHQMRG